MAAAPTDDVAWGGVRSRPRRTWILFPLVTLLVLAIGGTALWYAAVNRAGTEFDAWLAREASLGRVWTCPNRTFHGYPLQIAFDCTAPTFTGETRDGTVTGTAKALRAYVLIYQPTRITADLEGPVEVRTADGRDVSVNWRSLEIGVKGLPFAIDRIAFDVDGPVATLKSDDGSVPLLSAGQASVHVRRVLSASDGDAGFEVTAHLADGIAPMLDRISGSKDPVGAEILATITRADPLERGPLARRLEGWRLGGGRVEITDAKVTKGQAWVAANGTLDLDDARRPRGDLDASFAGLDPVLKRLGIPLPTAKVAGLILGSLFGAPKPTSSAGGPDATSAGAMRLTLTLADGRVAIGPVPLPVRLGSVY